MDCLFVNSSGDLETFKGLARLSDKLDFGRQSIWIIISLNRAEGSHFCPATKRRFSLVSTTTGWASLKI